jgi:tetratricopeptide (TPR) repeat protein
VSEAENQAITELLRNRNFKEALERIQPLVAAHPETEQVLLYQVAIYQGLGQDEDCQQKVLTFLSRYQSSAMIDQILYFYANSLWHTGRKKEALSYLQSAGTLTKDPTLKKNVEVLLRLWNRPDRIGLNLGGRIPATTEEREERRNLAVRVLDLGLADYYKVNGKYPDKLELLLEGTPPYLRNLPENPLRPGNTFSYSMEGAHYQIGSLE